MIHDINSILIKVESLYNLYGIKSITMDDVAREMGISKKTLYRFFNDKKELVEKVIEHQQETWDVQLAKIREKSENAIDELFRVHSHVNEAMKHINPAVNYDLQKYYPEIFDEISRRRRINMQKHLTENMHKGIEQGLYREDINVNIIAMLYLLRIENLVENEMMKFVDCTSK
jgi:AcrR family transcriptional regulator